MVKFYFWLFSESYNCIISIFQFFVLLIWSLSLNILLASSSLILWAFITKTNIFIGRVASLISLFRINRTLFPFENIRLPLINSSISINIHIILTLWSLLYQSFVCLFPQFYHIREFLTYKRKILQLVLVSCSIEFAILRPSYEHCSPVISKKYGIREKHFTTFKINTWRKHVLNKFNERNLDLWIQVIDPRLFGIELLRFIYL